MTRLVVGFHHPAIVTPDLERGIAFYSQLLDYRVLSRSTWQVDDAHINRIIGLAGAAGRFCMLQGPNAYLELFEYELPETLADNRPRQAFEPGIRHLAFTVTDAAAAVARCVALGGSRINDPKPVTGRAAAAYCRDPFGNLIEFVQPLGGFPELDALSAWKET